MSAVRNNRLSLLLVAMLMRMRKSEWLSAVYRITPPAFRARVSRVVWGRMASALRFPPLPQERFLDQLDQKDVRACSGATGVNIYGHLSGAFGLGESARLYAKAFAEAGIPISVTSLDLGLPHELERFELRGCENPSAPHLFDLVAVNPDYLREAIPMIDQAGCGRYRIASWFWELEVVPDDWRWALEEVDEIMVASAFIEDAFRRVSDKPILKIPVPIQEVVDSGLTRQDFGLLDDAFLFLTTFDFHSSVHRKNPRAVISAFQRAFADSQGNVALLVKSSNGFRYPEALSELVDAARGDPRISIRDEVIPAPHLKSLQRCADVYVSLHRAEGFGLGLAESMALGKPVVATAWSGNMEFMSSENSCLVDYRLVPVPAGQYPGASGARWADPDVDHAASYMKRLATDAVYAKGIGERAADDIKRILSPSRSASILSRRLEDLATKMGIRVETDPAFASLGIKESC